MMIIEAIRAADTEQAVYSLLTAYLEAVGCLDGGAGLPAPVKRLPIARGTDVRNRARLLHGKLKARNGRGGELALLDEAARLFNAAWARLRILDVRFHPKVIHDALRCSRLPDGLRLRPHVPLVIGCVALAVMYSLWATAAQRARAVFTDAL
jgi:hypothetical protein